MSSDFEKMQKRAVEIRSLYNKYDSRPWGIDQVFMGMIKDIGELSKMLMVKGGYRTDFKRDLEQNIRHELSDLLYSVFVLADKAGVDLKGAFLKSMDEIAKLDFEK